MTVEASKYLQLKDNKNEKKYIMERKRQTVICVSKYKIQGNQPENYWK